jgi:hypothetical protein
MQAALRFGAAVIVLICSIGASDDCLPWAND